MFTNFFKSFGVGTRNYELVAPVAGHVVPLSSVQDETFAKGLFGQGLAIQPTGNRIVAPSSGKIESIFPTGHALALHTVEGLHVLIHVGIDTYESKDGCFKVNVAEGDAVRKGDVLIEFDRETLIADGFDVTVPILICNSAEFASIKGRDGIDVDELDSFITARAR